MVAGLRRILKWVHIMLIILFRMTRGGKKYVTTHCWNINYSCNAHIPICKFSYALKNIIHICHLQSCQVVIRNESEILNVGMSKPPKVASRPAGGL